MNRQPLHSFFKKLYLPQIIACLLLAIAIYFLRQQRHELQRMAPYLHQAATPWLMVAAAVSIVYILLQSGMYKSSFAAVGSRLKWPAAIELFLKRNLLSVFVPGGGVSALAYTPGSVKRSVTERLKIHQASGLYAFAGLLSLFIVGFPVLILHVQQAQRAAGFGLAAMAMAALLAVLFFHYKGPERMHRLLQRRFPKLSERLFQLTNTTVDKKQYGRTIAASVGVELCGIFHVYIAMLAIGVPPSLPAAAVAYVTTVLLMVASPFLKGLGAVELSLVYVLTQAGYAPPQALAITLVYRFFEFWLPFAVSVLAFLQKGTVLFLRIVPPLSIFLLGLVNILSVITPPIKARLHWVNEMIPSPAIHATNLLVLFIGVGSMVCAAFLIKGLRNAWWMAVAIAALSVVGHLAKAWDYEEAAIAGAVLLLLLLTRNQYRRRSNPRLVTTGIAVTLLSFVAILIYGFIGFYFLEKRHFGIDFTWRQSALYAMRGFLLLQMPELHPLTLFGSQFLHSFYVLGLLAWSFLFITLVKPYLYRIRQDTTVKKQAQALLTKYSYSMLDYFKLASDKQLFLAQNGEGFVSYTVAGGFAIALEEPVCAPESKLAVLREFDLFCRKAGLKAAFYRIDESNTVYFTKLKKKKLLIGQEAILNVNAFTLNGRDKKSLRNGLNNLQKRGFVTTVHHAPHASGFVQQLKRVSDAWLQEHGRAELQFSQGAFDEAALQQQDVIATFDAAGNVVAFLNIIPSFAPGECTYDLIRKTADAPGGCMDALIIELIDYAKAHHFQTLNLGLVPLSGIEQPHGTAEQVLKYAYEKSPWFRQYRGLRAFKEKYASGWRNKYLAYDNDFDLLQLPNALKKAMRLPPQKLKAV